MSDANYVWLNDLSRQFLGSDYLLEGQTVHDRVSVIAAEVEKRIPIPGIGARVIHGIQRGWFSLSSPIWSNFGNGRGLPISCFGSYVSDTTDSLLSTHAEVGMMSKYGGGTSAYFGEVRPRGAAIKDNGKSSGAVHFMKMFETLVGVISQGSCYVEGTEVLTSNGFKDFREVGDDDKLAQLDEFGNITFTADYELVVNDFDGILKCFTGKKRDDSVSLKVTPNHRMVIERCKTLKRRRFWKGSTEITTAADLNLHRDNRFKLSGKAVDGAGLSFEDRFRIAFQADGQKDAITRRMRFHFSKQRKIDRLKWILENLGLEYTTYVNVDGTTDFSIECVESLKIPTLSEWIKLDRVTYQWAKEFIEEIRHWDGSLGNNTTIYNSGIRSNVDLVQAIACLADKKTRFKIRPAHENRNELYIVYISDGNHRGGDSVVQYDESYVGKVYCAVVPNGRLLVRHNGRTIVCGNTRRGSFAAYLPIDHGDIEEFLTIKSEGSPIQDISFGVTIEDSWMESMIAGDAEKRRIWAKVLQSRANVGYPYIVFIDNANNATADVYRDKQMRIYSSNLCSEILEPTSPEESFVCCLLSMNAATYDEWKGTDAVETATCILDAVMSEFVDKARGLPYMGRAVRFAERHRALGIGVMGWHTLLQKRMIPFESMEAKYLNVELFKGIRDEAYAASSRLADLLGEPELLEGYGRRNTVLMAVAPTKSSSFILGQVSQGIELYRTNYDVMDRAKGKYLVKNRQLEALLEDKGRNTPDVWDKILKDFGSVRSLDFLSDHEKAVFKTNAETSQKEVVIQAAQRQKFIDQGQSLNLMIHPSVPLKDVNALYIDAWRMGIKSLYYQYSVNAAQELSNNLLACASCEA